MLSTINLTFYKFSVDNLHFGGPKGLEGGASNINVDIGRRKDGHTMHWRFFTRESGENLYIFARRISIFSAHQNHGNTFSPVWFSQKKNLPDPGA